MKNEIKLPNIKVGDLFLFEDEPLNTQGHKVVMIREVNGNTLIDYIPEWTPVRNHGTFHYGRKNFRIIKNYNQLLTYNDSIIKLSGATLVEVKDLYNMMKRNLPLVVKWEFTKHIPVTKNGMTLFYLTVKYFEFEHKENRPIGLVYPPVTLIEWVLRESEFLNF